MPITPVPSMTTTPPFPALADRAAGTYNSKAYAFGTHMSDTFNDELVAVAESVVDNATDAAASAESSEENAALTAADRVQTGLDVIATAADRVQTGLDKVATAADRVQTGLDKVAAAGSATAAALAAEAAEAAAESISGGPVTSVNGRTGVVNGLAEASDLSTGLAAKLDKAGGSLTGGVNDLKGPDIASAATTMNIWAAAQGNVMTVTGTTTATGLPAAPQAGATRTLIAAAAWPLTHGANFILPGSANYTCAAGDIIEVTAITTTQFRLKITKADGTAISGGVTNGNKVELSRATPSGAATVDFVSLLTSTYDEYVLEIENFYPSTSAALYLRTSTDNGSSYDSTGYEYAATRVASSSSTVNGSNGSGVGQIDLTGGQSIRSDAGFGGISLSLRIIRPTATQVCHISWKGGFSGSSGGIHVVDGHAARFTEADVTAIRLLMSSGTITSGIAILYGVKK